MKSELKFEDNFTCFSWLLDFIPSTVTLQSKRRFHESSDFEDERAKKVASTAITITSPVTVVNGNVQAQVELVK